MSFPRMIAMAANIAASVRHRFASATQGAERRRAPWLASVAAAGTLLASSCAGIYDDGPTSVSASASVRSQNASVSASYFYDDLSPHGRWIDYGNYGWCWTPYQVAADWRPYSEGHWIYTDFGWTWDSYEPWGWATYHYGRWTFDPYYGWLWVPGTVWGPAWVAWRYGDDYIGWAALPPSSGWDVSVGLRYEAMAGIQPAQWCFVPQRQLWNANLRHEVAPVARNVTLLDRTRDATRIEARGGRPINAGIDIALFERQTDRSVQRMKVVDVESRSRGRARMMGGSVGFFRPKPDESELRRPPRANLQREIETAPEPELKRQRDMDQRRLESSLAEQRARLESEQQREVQVERQGPRSEAIRQRHAAEKQAFEQHASQQRQVFEQRWQKKIVKPPRAKEGAKAEEKGKGKEKSKQKKSGGGS